MITVGTGNPTTNSDLSMAESPTNIDSGGNNIPSSNDSGKCRVVIASNNSQVTTHVNKIKEEHDVTFTECTPSDANIYSPSSMSVIQDVSVSC